MSVKPSSMQWSALALGNGEQLAARKHDEPGGLDPHRPLALERLQFLVHPLARGTEQLCEVFLRELQADARNAVALLLAVAACKQQDLLGQARGERTGVEVFD